ncbi:hypothetical protein [Nocardiopsis valliformis]|uniref:hypothetical protein n=1 Tax=Nocardiopsis valliformis TaxID=239974 RepID=UPI00034A8776|nr:hypothetical protein [Nocardiopsis valliformis]
MSHPCRPTFDPVLPARTIERLSARPERLIPKAKGPPGRPTWRESALALSLGCTTAAALALLLNPLVLPLSILLCLGTTAFVLGLVSYRNGTTDDWADLVMHSFWALPLSVVGVLGARVALDQVLGPLGTVLPGDPSLAALYLTAAIAGGGAIMHPGMAARLSAENHDRYVLPEDFGRPSSYATRREEPEAHLFARLQQATDRVEEGRRVLGDSFDATHTLPLLKEEEWRLAKELLRLRTLRRELLQRRKNAVSDQVTQALAPQNEAVTRAHKAISTRVDALAAYGERVHAAVTAHREWEQCQEIADRAGDYADLALNSGQDPVRTDELDSSLLSVQAAHTVREELVQEAVAAGSSLSDALHPRPRGPQQDEDPET